LDIRALISNKYQRNSYKSGRQLLEVSVTDDISSDHERRGLATAFALCALATLLLLANHPGNGAHSLADLIKSEARNQLIDGLVHGGFIVILGALIVCFVFLSRYLGAARTPVVIGLVAFCIGSGALMASMTLDGFATPAIAVRLAGTDSADNPVMAKTLLILVGALVRILMPMGMLFQSAAMFSWSSVIVRHRGLLPRAAGAFGLAVAVSLIVAVVAVPTAMATHVLLSGIVLQAIWYFALAAVLFRRGALDLAIGLHSH
jgi:hypothetical protein